MIFTTLFALFGKAAPDLWLVVARAGAVMAVAMVFKVAARLDPVARGLAVPARRVERAASRGARPCWPG